MKTIRCIRLSFVFVPLLTMAAESVQADSPSVPANTRALIYSGTAAELFWDRSSDDGYVRGYDLTRNDISLGELDALSLFENDLEPGVRYRYSITAVDDQGNRSPTVTLALISGEGVVDAESASAVPSPANLKAEVYSASAIELFWDREDSPGLVYQISRENTLIGETDGTSFFIDGLNDTQNYSFDVKAVDAADATSTMSTVLVNTRGGDIPTDNPTDNPSDPPINDKGTLKNVKLAIYSVNATELSWERPSASDDVVSVEVIRGGDSVGSTFGTSYYDDSRSPDTNQTYQLLAIDSNGERTLSANIGQFENAVLNTGVGEAAFGNYGHVAVSGDTAVLPADRELINGDYVRTGAVYVFTRDAAEQWQQTQKLTASSDGGRGFGLSVAIDGNTLAIGQRFIPTSDEYGTNRGSVTVYSRDASGQWGNAQTLVVEAADRVYRIGNSIGIDGNTMMVGANNDVGKSPLFVFERDNDGQWLQIQELSLDYEDSELGTAIEIDGNTAILGDYRDPEHGFLTGAAWIYTRNNDGTWSQGAHLSPSAAEEGDYLGTSVGLSGDTAVIGGENSPKAYVFARSADGEWTETQILRFDIPDYQGTFVDLDEDTVVVGTRSASRLGYDTGAVQVFRKFDNQWIETAVLGSSDGQRFSSFGEAVSIDGKTVVTGALIRSSDYNATGTNAYVHRLD